MQITLNGNKKFIVSGMNPDDMNLVLNQYSYKVTQKKWDFRTKKWIWHANEVEIKIPKVINVGTIEMKMGYIFSFCNFMYPRLDKEQVKQIVSHFTNTDFRIENYYNLEDRDNAYANLDTLLKYKYGLLQIPTGSGKTEMIVTIIRNIVDKGEKVLVISETTPVLDEIRMR